MSAPSYYSTYRTAVEKYYADDRKKAEAAAKKAAAAAAPTRKTRRTGAAEITHWRVLEPLADAATYPVAIGKSVLVYNKYGFEADGLFAARRIDDGVVVAEYTGKLLYAEDRDLDDMNDYVEVRAGAGILIDGRATEYIDPATGVVTRAWGRFANSYAGLAPAKNAAMTRELGKEAGGAVETVRVVLKTSRVVEEGEEILTDYGPGYQFRGTVSVSYK